MLPPSVRPCCTELPLSKFIYLRIRVTTPEYFDRVRVVQVDPGDIPWFLQLTPRLLSVTDLPLSKFIYLRIRVTTP